MYDILTLSFIKDYGRTNIKIIGWFTRFTRFLDVHTLKVESQIIQT